jgi:hypothetical protein
MPKGLTEFHSATLKDFILKKARDSVSI